MADDGVSLPKATILKMAKDFLPPDMRVAGDTVDMLIECCSEFVQLLSSEANEVSTKEGKNIIHPEHVVKALQDLGFPEFVPEVNLCWEQFKADQKGMPKLSGRKTAAEEAGLTEEEQIALQQQLFAAARMRSLQADPATLAVIHSAAQQAGGIASQPSSSEPSPVHE